MPQPDDPTRCTQTTADGRRCRMPRVNSHVTLCGTHLEAQQRRLRKEPVRHAQDAMHGVTDLRSATAVNHVLGNLSGMLTDGRIDFRKAAVLAYLCQLLLQSISMANQERWDDDPPPGTLPPPSLPAPTSSTASKPHA
ncbi:MAG TPA: hypothetical protein VJX29_06685 [Candidatus Acidoferrales bacterium]|nr:hypothetical protein [Candidatus Acidoferrales bacterium]